MHVTIIKGFCVKEMQMLLRINLHYHIDHSLRFLFCSETLIRQNLSENYEVIFIYVENGLSDHILLPKPHSNNIKFI